MPAGAPERQSHEASANFVDGQGPTRREDNENMSTVRRRYPGQGPGLP